MPLPIGDVGYKGRNRFVYFKLGPFEILAANDRKIDKDCTTIRLASSF